MIFLAHSHRDQATTYALSEWIHRAWPDVDVFFTHRHLPELEDLLERHYLSVVPHAEVVFGLVSKDSLGSDAVAWELQVARRSSRPVLLALHPHVTPGEWRELQAGIEVWREVYGDVIDLRAPAGAAVLAGKLSAALGRPWPSSRRPEALAELAAKPRTLPLPSRLTVPDTEAIFSGRASREEAEQWLAILLKGWDHRVRSRGLESGIGVMERLFSPESRAAQLLASYPSRAWRPLMIQLRPLINDAFRTETELLIQSHGGRPELTRAWSALLLLSAEIERDG